MNVIENMKAHVNPLNRNNNCLYHSSITFDRMVPMNHEPQTLIIINNNEKQEAKTENINEIKNHAILHRGRG